MSGRSDPWLRPREKVDLAIATELLEEFQY